MDSQPNEFLRDKARTSVSIKQYVYEPDWVNNFKPHELR